MKAPAVSEVCRQSEASARTVERACDTSIRVAVLVRALSNDLADGSELQASGDPWRVAREIIRGLRQKKRELACGADGSSTDDQFNKCVAAIINFMPQCAAPLVRPTTTAQTCLSSLVYRKLCLT